MEVIPEGTLINDLSKYFKGKSDVKWDDNIVSFIVSDTKMNIFLTPAWVRKTSSNSNSKYTITKSTTVSNTWSNSE